jgi:two-component system, NarL family, response regulator NreC
MEFDKTIRVLLADDHAMVRRGLRRILEKVPHIVVIGEAGTGAAAIQLVHELKPDVLLLDMEMPDMKGYTVTRQLRDCNVPVSILVVSACDEEYFMEELLRDGADEFLSKGVSPEAIREAVYRVFAKHSQVSVVAGLFIFLVSPVTILF